MRILHIISDTVLGGAQRVCIDLANSANSEGNIVGVAAMKGGNLWNELNENINQFHLEYMKKSIGKHDIKVLKELRKIKKEFNPDIIHLHTSKPGVLGRWVFRKNKNHIVYTIHGFDQIRIAHKKFLPIEKLFQKYSGANVPVSNYDKNNMLDCGITNKIKVIYNGINSLNIKSEKKFPVNIKESKKVLTIARIAPPKDFELFLNVAKEFINKDTAFIWIGGSKDISIDELKIKYNIPDNVYLLGDIPNAINYINLCDLFVLFSKHEGLPMSIIEAMSQKKAVVASNVGGIPELVSEENGALISNCDEAIYEINKILLNDNVKLHKENASFVKYIENFTLSKMWNNYKELYLQLLN